MTAVIISVLALVGTFYQLYLQRIHNEKSLKPLVQIDLIDRNNVVAIHIQNNGVGPFIVEKLNFYKSEQTYFKIEDCLNLNPRSYQRALINESVKKVILPGGFIEVFSTRFDEKDSSAEIENVLSQLTDIKLKVEGRDIYNNRIIAKRELDWFTRHSENKIIDLAS